LVLDGAGLTPGGLALAIVHYFHPRVARRAADALGFPPERVIATAEAEGHVAAAGIPIALAGATASGRVGKGDVVLCTAFGAGMCWGAAILRL
jgi:3-oxoacyl-[acyl-carrier-protein] synthase-3